jgi:class 3 adenylate cyclase/pimeloyl-ACP methyl ester carboxylesterase
MGGDGRAIHSTEVARFGRTGDRPGGVRIRLVEIPPETRYVDRGGRSIAFQSFGSGDRCLVHMPTSVGNLDLLWTNGAMSDVLSSFAERANCLMYDQLGYGLSDPVDHIPTLEERCGDLTAVMDAAGSERATLSAQYDTCLTALLFAAQHPERVDGLVLSAPFAQGWRSAPFEQIVGWESEEQMEAFDRAYHGAIDRWGHGDLLTIIAPALATPRNVRVFCTLERAGASPAMARMLHQLASTADIRDVLSSVQAPTLVLRPPGNMMAAGVMRLVAELCPNATYGELVETGDIGTFWADHHRRIEGLMFGSAHETNPSRTVMTFLFTDIVGSTEKLAQLGDARWRNVLIEHERMLRQQVEDSGGRLRELIGDGSLSTFNGPARAIRCAERICASAGVLGVNIRAGVHTGECERMADHIVGMALHVAARVSASAGPGEVRVSRVARDLLAGSGIELQPQGEHELKGVPGTWELFSVAKDTLPLPAPDQHRELRAADRAILLLARRAPGLLRAASRIGAKAIA